MAMILITIQDLPKGDIDVRMHSEPPVLPSQTEFTDAQRMGAVALNAIRGALEEQPPKLLIAGADELPH